jgi:hypothetical protein
MSDEVTLTSVDQSAIKVSQACTIVLLVIGFVLDLWVLVAAVAVINLVGLLIPALSLWRQLYLKVLRPAHIVRPNVIPDHHEPHRFAQGVGGVLALTATVLLLLGQAAVGWGLAWFHIVFVYYRMNQLGVPGFKRSRIGG